MEQEVPFIEEPIRNALSDEEFEALHKLCPSGTARFWGALSRHDAKMDRLTTGDPVLFTGNNEVQALGKVGCKLRNTALADLLWTPDLRTGSWGNVYTVLEFQRRPNITYSEIRDLAGTAGEMSSRKPTCRLPTRPLR